MGEKKLRVNQKFTKVQRIVATIFLTAQLKLKLENNPYKVQTEPSRKPHRRISDIGSGVSISDGTE